MSRIGKAPIAVPSGVDVTVAAGTVTVKGPKGTLSRVIPGDISDHPGRRRAARSRGPTTSARTRRSTA